MRVNRDVAAAFLADVAFLHPVADEGLVAGVGGVQAAQKAAVVVTATRAVAVAVVSHGLVRDDFGDIFEAVPFPALGASVAFVPALDCGEQTRGNGKNHHKNNESCHRHPP